MILKYEKMYSENGGPKLLFAKYYLLKVLFFIVIYAMICRCY